MSGNRRSDPILPPGFPIRFTVWQDYLMTRLSLHDTMQIQHLSGTNSKWSAMAAHTRWTSFDLVFFDCDSTLSSIEGVDELARLKGKEWRVGLLTQKAMDGDLDRGDVYGKRLRGIRPTRGQLAAIEQVYWGTLVPDARQVIGVR